MEIKLNRCSCGALPSYREWSECGGHGLYFTHRRVQCECGNSTKSCPSEEEACKEWNEKHPLCDFCSTFDIDYFDIDDADDVDPENLFISRCVSSCDEAKVNLYLNAHGKRGLYFDILHWFPGRDIANTVGVYKPKFCPECGRDLRKINGFIKGDENEST